MSPSHCISTTLNICIALFTSQASSVITAVTSWIMHRRVLLWYCRSNCIWHWAHVFTTILLRQELKHCSGSMKPGRGWHCLSIRTPRSRNYSCCASSSWHNNTSLFCRRIQPGFPQAHCTAMLYAWDCIIGPCTLPIVSPFQLEIRRWLWATVVELTLQSSLDNSSPPLRDLKKNVTCKTATQRKRFQPP